MAVKKAKSAHAKSTSGPQRGGARRKTGVDKQREKQRKKPRGKPFEKGNRIGFKTGQSGNPAGRPKSVKFLSEAYRAWLAQPSAADPERTNADMVAEAIGKQALAGDITAAHEICDRAEGKPRQAIDISVEQKKREMLENVIEAFMTDAGVESRDEAERLLAAANPEISRWIDGAT